jgi:hypothetical protein
MEHTHRQLLEVNNSPVGAHYINAPTDYRPGKVFLKRQGVPFYVQRQTQYHDWSYVPEWHHPPYEKKPTDPWIGVGYMSHKFNTFPIIY